MRLSDIISQGKVTRKVIKLLVDIKLDDGTEFKAGDSVHVFVNNEDGTYRVERNGIEFTAKASELQF